MNLNKLKTEKKDIIQPADLFDKIAEVSILIPEENWRNIDIETYKEFPAHYYRLRMIQSISRFYGIQNLSKFYSFPVIYSEEEYEELHQRLVSIFAQYSEFTKDNINIDWNNFPLGCYKLLFSYRMKMETFLNQEVYLESKIYQSVHNFINEHNRQFHHLASELSVILGYFVDLHNKHTTVQELIDKYDYPDVDIDEIDLEWV